MRHMNIRLVIIATNQVTMLIQFNAALKRIELQKRALSHLKDLFKSFQYLIYFSTFEQILGSNLFALSSTRPFFL